MKLANEVKEDLFAMHDQDIKDSFTSKLNDFGFENVFIDDVATEIGGDTVVTFIDEDGDELEILFTYDPDDGALAVILEDGIDYTDDEEDPINFIDMDSINPKILDLGNGVWAIDLVDLSWLNEDTLEAILTSGDLLDDAGFNVSERSAVVIRKGKKVRLPVVRRRRRKRLTPKAKAAIKRGVRKRRTKKGAIARKRKKSLKLRKRIGLKRNTNKRVKVAGTSRHL